MEEFINSNKDEIEKYVAAKYDMKNTKIYLLDSRYNTYNKSINKFYQEIKKIMNIAFIHQKM